MAKTTTVQVSEETRRRLSELKRGGESYDSVIQKLLDKRVIPRA